MHHFRHKEILMNQPKSTAKKSTQKSSKSTTASAKNLWTEEERAAMREAAKERKAEQRMNNDRAAGEKAVLAKIAQMKGSDQAMAKRIHEIVTAGAPDLMPRTWYGMPAYANKDGKIICFFQDAAKFKARYATFGFNDSARLDEGSMWATSYALKELTPADAAKIAALVKKAVS
jgi:uncharacterized protein YdhG (YjbR/CyaY superfamily)